MLYINIDSTTIITIDVIVIRIIIDIVIISVITVVININIYIYKHIYSLYIMQFTISLISGRCKDSHSARGQLWPKTALG